MDDFSATGFQPVQLGILLGRAAALKDRLLDRHLTPLGITAGQLKVLRIIRHGENTAVALCRHLSIHSAAMTRMLDRIERKGLIVRLPDDQDQRKIRLALTIQGEAISSVLPTMEVAAMNEFTASLTSEELLLLESLLEKMLCAG
ncbi:MarR family transcriptional regulator [Pseudomonas sp. UYIF39]|uniref:MarR family winged helix-turn-helix transcriptional regulator n=1 Tax=Pseudomonas sp. UYIF39 TaxID=1630747 RepID=UPI00249E39E0|nr:MarR family transcriptional regulator [Pseudomonas sp. UYIF39]MDI3356327.1 MarR family transcriptional regulator [Pseudomonas sp. UYIF39]